MFSIIANWFRMRRLSRPGDKAFFEAVTGLSKTKERRALPRLVRVLEHQDPNVRKAAAWALGEIGDPKAATALMPLLEDRAPPVREASARAIGQLGDRQGVLALIRTLGDPDPTTRKSAAKSLTRLGEKRWHASGTDRDFESLSTCGDPRAVQALIYGLKNPNWYIRKTVIEGIGTLGSRQAAPALRAALRDTNHEVRHAAAVALQHMGEPLELVEAQQV